MIDELRRDRARYAGLGGWYKRLGFWVGATYRLGAWARTLPAVLRVPLVIFYRLVRVPWLMILNVNIPAGVRIAPGLCLIHPRNILIPAGVEIGEDCLIFHDVTIGTGPTPGLPKIGRGVDIYVGARVLGGITIGEGSMVGANCVVTRSVPAGSVVLTPPARIISRALISREVNGASNLADRAPAAEG